jgi:hypothetical protein
LGLVTGSINIYGPSGFIQGDVLPLTGQIMANENESTGGAFTGTINGSISICFYAIDDLNGQLPPDSPSAPYDLAVIDTSQDLTSLGLTPIPIIADYSGDTLDLEGYPGGMPLYSAKAA